MNSLRYDCALRIEFTTNDPEGYVWICMPNSEIGWNGIGQENPVIKTSGNQRYVIISYNTLRKYVGEYWEWPGVMYLKGNKDWSVQSISVIDWKE